MSDDRVRVLLVEDNELACEEFRTQIREWENFQLVAATGKQSEAIRIAVSGDIDAIVLDLELYEGDGIGFLEELNGKIITDKPFIIVTTNTQSQTILHLARQLGADFIYQKTNLNYAPNQIIDFIQKSLKFHTRTKEKSTRTRRLDFNNENENRIIKRTVSTTLASMGFMATYKGTSLLRDAIIIVAKADRTIQITKDVYPALAKEYGMTINSVEKNIRTVIENTWLYGDKKIIEAKYPFIIHTDNGRPTNMNFICNMAELFKD